MPVTPKSESSPAEPDNLDRFIKESESFEDLENKVQENDNNDEEITCPTNTTYLERWSAQVPVHGKLAPYIEKCLE